MSGPQLLSMEILFILIWASCLLPVQPGHTDHYAYCETCLTAAQEIEKAMKEAPAQRRRAVVENLISGGVCKKLLSHKNTDDTLVSSCSHLFDFHYDQFRAALVDREPKNLDIVLCYEQSTACVGVKRQSFQDSKDKFTESVIDALLQENKENVRIAQLIHTNLPKQPRDEF